jgi:hypothetical protein
MEAHLNEIIQGSNPTECSVCKTPFVGLEQVAWLSKATCLHCSPTVSTSFSVKLARHYLPRVWPGLFLTLPALLVLPEYDKSLWFHMWMSLAWVYWLICIYKLHATLRKKNRSYEVSPAKASAITAVMGSHPFNYLLEFFAMIRTNFPATALGLLIIPAIPLAFIFGFWWYLRMFRQVCRFVAEQCPDLPAPMNPGGAIALVLLLPGTLQLLLHVLGIYSECVLWFSETLFPIGLAAAFYILLSFRNKVIRLLADDTDFPRLAQASPKETGIMPSDRLCEHS